MTDKELMQQALDALEGYARNCRCEGGGAPCDAAEALRARLAQPKRKWQGLTVEEVEQAMEQSKGAEDRLKKFYELLDDMLWKKNKLRQYKEENT